MLMYAEAVYIDWPNATHASLMSSAPPPHPTPSLPPPPQQVLSVYDGSVRLFFIWRVHVQFLQQRQMRQVSFRYDVIILYNVTV